MSDVVKIAEMLAEEFRERAAQIDAEGRFPTENYDRMREVGYLKALVPEELGGLGATIDEMARAQQALARGCASTALAVNMHQFQIGAAADAYRAGGPTGPALKKVAEDGIVLGSTSAEFIVAGEWTTPTTAELDGDDYIVNGRKFFCSQADGMDVVRVNATEVGSGDLLVIAFPVTTPGVQIIPTWDTTGMRGTSSHDVVLENVRVPAAGAVRLPGNVPIHTPQAAGVIRWFLLLMPSVYLGLAEEARSLALSKLGGGRNSAFRAAELTDVMIGEMEAAWMTALSVRDATLAKLTEPGGEPGQIVAAGSLCKQLVTSAAQTVVDKAVALSGGSAFFRRSPMERIARDMQAAKFHPPAAPVSFQIIGAETRAIVESVKEKTLVG
ncbi:MAG: acyl-CoA/acyl-ACP dehydrogenase [Chloroflexi bacterium]|jgi:alkylation response protein AidB-like acyl-CoA dehydrogenase|nr:acyl-CoA/acyl-ACP dehydrogenase [Chloroflexota bacterium]MBT4074347.1 acyl-CoA/acyl-ACP dehydrogenase [Chloroflexota bacterium]MBT4514698.1 acyl-CoA/acyl-ACP dehydrogenase [Chloroflexota bacterium]MBT6681543.1 acyl-CoA/acyl-ACP dehydrogenase [Chloroflexota bacterium]